ncbi:tripartite tricarboxylate transporter substrate binding protein [Pigmentiphaga soli]|uniref:Tripartite tricarboxylate transporter substrate binding protein n=1 Tax=Pigmentiphaga soli TaxID=1007095 RepID=A0ABP8GLX3_9BURK
MAPLPTRGPGGSAAARAMLCAALAWTCCVAAPARAGQYPERPVRIVVPVAAGGNQDLVIRAVAQKLSEQMEQPFIVENRPSASGLVGTAYVAKEAADGYTLLSVSNTFVTAPGTVKAAAYDPVKDFTGVSVVASLPLVILAHPSMRVETVQDLIDLARKRPGELTYGSAGTGSNSHMAMALFNLQAGIRMSHVPYKGNAMAVNDLLGGHIGFVPDTISTSLPYIRTGKVKAIAVTSAKRAANLQDVPTVAESGMPGYELVVFNAVMAPAGVPPAILRRLQSEIAKAVASPELRAQFASQGVELAASASPEECTAFIKREFEKYTRILDAAGIKPE